MDHCLFAKVALSYQAYFVSALLSEEPERGCLQRSHQSRSHGIESAIIIGLAVFGKVCLRERESTF